MRLAVLLAMGMLSFLSLSAQVQNNAYNLTLKTLLAHSVPEVSVLQLKEMSDVLLLDAREWEEYTVSHIKNAMFVGYNQFDTGKVRSLNKKQKIVVYCSVGYRSEKISEKLKQAGFTDVSNLYGGIFEWVNQLNPVVNQSGEVTRNIHAYSKTWGIWLSQGIKVYDDK